MKLIHLAFVPGTLVLAACSSEQANEVSAANEVAIETLNETLPANEVVNASDNVVAPGGPEASPPQVERPRQGPPVREKAEPTAPKEEPVDPHAGHDMNNMSHH